MPKPNLGLATTEELLREVICRLKISAIAYSDNYAQITDALVLAELLGGMSSTVKEYRTVDDA